MPRDLTIILADRPGELARVGEAAGQAGVNIQGLAAFTGEGRGVVHILVADDAADRCQQALEAAGLGVADNRPVLLIDIADQPGTLGELTRQLAQAHVNVDLAYTTFGGIKIVIATEDLASARAILRQ
jgi:hypothetical protein